MKHRLQILFFVLTLTPAVLFSQGNVGIGTSTPQEKLDINGAIIIRGSGAAATPVPGTIRWNSTSGYHEGRTSTPAYIKIENSESSNSGDYTAYSGCTSPVTVGVFEGSNPATGYAMPNYLSSPFNTWWGGDRTQLLYRASELTAAGLCSGNITMIGFIVIAPGVYSIANLEIKMKNTATTSLTSYETGLTSVYSTAAYTLVVGNNDYTLASPFYWDGTSNLCVEVCWNNNVFAILSGCIVQLDNGYGYNTGYGFYDDLTPTICSAAISPQSSTSRPVTRFGTTGAIAITGVDTYYKFSDALVVGNPTLFYGATNHGPGTVTAESVYDDNSLLSDFVFDEYFDGKVKEEDFNNCYTYRLLTLTELKKFLADYRHLPSVPGRDEWNENGKLSLGELLTALWVSAEDQAIYIKEIHEKSESLQKQIIDHKEIIIQKMRSGIDLINSDTHLSSTTKQKKITELESMITTLENM